MTSRTPSVSRSSRFLHSVAEGEEPKEFAKERVSRGARKQGDGAS